MVLRMASAKGTVSLRPICCWGGREDIADEAADGEVHVERSVGSYEGKPAGHHGCQAMLLAQQHEEVFGGALVLAVARVWSARGGLPGQSSVVAARTA